jgi:flagellar hook-associated protein 1 FlgK
MQTIGTFAGINIGASALTAASLGESVVGNNIANANTPGYSDESLVLANSTPAVSNDLTQGAFELGYIGTGVTSVTVTRANNEFLAGQVYTANGAVSDQTAQKNQLSTVQAAFNEPGNTTINTELTQFFANFSAVQSNPSDNGVRMTAIQGGVTLAQSLNQTSAQLTTTADSIGQSITSDETQINALGSQIATLNAQIVDGSTLNGQPNSLLDQRDNLLTKLSNLVNINVQINPDGSDNIKIGGTVLVNGVNSTTVSASAMTARGDVTGGDLGGLQSSLTTLTSAQSQLDTLTQQIISQVNTIHAAGFGSDGSTGLAFFTGTGASNIAVNTAIVNNPQKLAVGSSLPGASLIPAPGDAGNAIAIGNLGTATLGVSAGALSGQTFNGYYNGLVTSVADTAAGATANLATATAAQTQLTNQQNQISGVNNDTELTKMMEYQRMYQAASEVISTQNSMLNTLINTIFTLN